MQRPSFNLKPKVVAHFISFFFFFYFFFASFYQETEFEFKARRQQSIYCADCFLRTDQGPIYTKQKARVKAKKTKEQAK